jgi:ATP/maltotriose-dependent transcriptional regulator MalT
MLDIVTAHVSSKVLIGRQADLAALRDALKRTRSAEPSTVLVGGEAGVGKTRLVEEFCRSAVADGAQVLTGQCLELGEEGLPFGPFAAALRELVHRQGPAVFEGREHEFASLLPELGPAGSPADTRRGYLFELVGSLFARLSETQPLVLVLEDLHWADRSTRDLIGFLVRSARLPHVLLVATYRTDELQRGHPLRPFLAELDRVRGVHRLELDRLDRDGTAEMLTQLRGVEPEPRVVENVAERTQGNPFFIEQFAMSGDPACGDIPASLRDLLLTRVDQLPETAQQVLRVAAVGGTRFAHDLLVRVAGLGEPELESAMRAIVAAQLVVVDPDGDEYEFRHALVREAVHDDLLPGEHARLHARYAEAIEADAQMVPMGRAPAEVAHHWYAAHDYPRALVAAKRAAADAGGRYAFAEQTRLLERVLELWEQVPDAADLLGISHLDLLEETALSAIDSGDHMRALSLTRAALTDLDAGAEPLRAARLLVRRSKLLYNLGKGNGVPEAEEAYRLIEPVPNSLERVRLMADVAYALGGFAGAKASEIAEQAKNDAIAIGDVSTEISTLITFGRVCASQMGAEESLVPMRQAAEQARASGDLPNLSRALVNISDALYELGRYEESGQAAAEGVPHADRVGVSRTTGVYLLANLAEALIAQGGWDEADARLAEAARWDPPGTLAVPWLRLRGQLRLLRGHEGADQLVSRAVSFLGRAFLDEQHRLPLQELRTMVAMQTGDPDAAVAVARTAVDEPAITTEPRYGWPLLAVAALTVDRASTGRPAASGLAGSGLAGSGHGGSGHGRSGLAGSGLAGSGDGGSGLAGSGHGGSGLAGSGHGGSGLAGSGHGGSGLAGSGLAESGIDSASPADDGRAAVASAGGARINAVAGAEIVAGGVPVGGAGGSAPVDGVDGAEPGRGSGQRHGSGVEDLRAQIAAIAARMPVRYGADRAYQAQVRATLEGGLDRWRETVALWRADGQRYPLAVSLLGLATAAAGAGDRPAASEAIEEAAAIALALGAAPLAEEADTLARRAGLRTASHPAAVGNEILTAREREVLRLVAEGRSNSRIAESLYISPKTASVHVSRIIAKLQVANRGEAAAVARRLGLLDEA